MSCRGSRQELRERLRVGLERLDLRQVADAGDLDELFLSQGACQLHHDPEYTPRSDEGETTLELAFPDQVCKVVLWNTEWNRGRAQPIAETMRSMRPLRLQGPTRPR